MTKHVSPERIEHLLPEEAEVIDDAARNIVNNLRSHSYRFVMPPIAQSIAALLDNDQSGSLAERTLQLTDPLGGRPIGIRADMTPQIRYIDASRLSGGVNRLCYLGSTIYSRPIKPWENREQLQVGAEVFGLDNDKSIIEVASLATNSLAKANVKDIAIAIGHAGIVNNLISSLDEDKASILRTLLGIKDMASAKDLKIDKTLFKILERVSSMHGGIRDLTNWEKLLPKNKVIKNAFVQLKKLGTLLTKAGVDVTYDLAGLTGYEYHSGVTFAILSGEKIIGRGGSYGDNKRPACGFSVNARALVDCISSMENPQIVLSKNNFGDLAWQEAVNKLIANGKQVKIVESFEKASKNTKQKLVKKTGKWKLASL